MIWVGIFGFIFIGAFAVSTWFGAPYLRTLKADRIRALDMLGDLRGVHLADFGCGDGQVLIDAASKGARVYGCEVNPFLYLVSKLRLGHRGQVQMKNFWAIDSSEFDVIFLFAQERLMQRFAAKLQKDNFRGRLVTFASPLPGMTASQTDGLVAVYDMT